MLAVNLDGDDELLLDDDSEEPGERDPLSSKGHRLTEFVARLEAMMEPDFFLDDLSGKRVALSDWIEWDESTCFGDSCRDDDFDQCDIPEEYKKAAPEVDVMSFLGLKRAEPLDARLARDWE